MGANWGKCPGCNKQKRLQPEGFCQLCMRSLAPFMRVAILRFGSLVRAMELNIAKLESNAVAARNRRHVIFEVTLVRRNTTEAQRTLIAGLEADIRSLEGERFGLVAKIARQWAAIERLRLKAKWAKLEERQRLVSEGAPQS